MINEVLREMKPKVSPP